MRIATYPALAVLAILVGLGVGYLLWGVQVADLNRQIQEQRSELNYRIGELEKRVKSAEERANQEAAARKVLEDQLHRVRPLK
jgi:uncharacterized protein HemX